MNHKSTTIYFSTSFQPAILILFLTGECRFSVMQSEGSLYRNPVIHCRLHFVREGQKVPCRVFDIGGREYVVRYVPVERGHYQLSVIVSYEDAPTIKFTHKFWSRLLTEWKG